MPSLGYSSMGNTVTSLYQSWQNAPEKRPETLAYARRLLAQYRGTADEAPIRRFLKTTSA